VTDRTSAKPSSRQSIGSSAGIARGSRASRTSVTCDTNPLVSKPIRERAPPFRDAGLGLAIVERVVRAHCGSLELLAREGGGLIARIRLPFDAQASA
jgi:hypothetical protein